MKHSILKGLVIALLLVAMIGSAIPASARNCLNCVEDPVGQEPNIGFIGCSNNGVVTDSNPLSFYVTGTGYCNNWFVIRG